MQTKINQRIFTCLIHFILITFSIQSELTLTVKEMCKKILKTKKKCFYY